MEFQVNINNVILAQINQVESGEYNVTECNFTFSSEYDGLTKKAVFTNEANETYVETIVDNICSIPSEVLKDKENVKLGVYAYDVDNEELLLRYSPRPTEFYVHEGSYKEGQNSTPPTPSEIEQLQAQITTNANNIEELQECCGKYDSDIEEIKAEQITQNNNIQTNTETIGTITENITIINEALGTINENIGDLQEGQIEQNTKIQNNADDIIEMKQDINEIDSSINDINQNIDDLEQDLTNYSLITETGSQINLNINSSNFQMTAILKDKNGNVIHTSNVIDLPLETMVVGASYDNVTKEVVLTLQNGTTLRFSVADLVEGLVSTDQLTQILSNYYNKNEVDALIPDLTDYVKNTDYATYNKGGTIKSGNGFGVYSTGFPYGSVLSKNDYDNQPNYFFISKGTLENVITGKELINQTQLEESQATQDTEIEALQAENAELKQDITNMAKAMYKVDGQGSDITLQNTSENKFVEFGLEGRTEQEQLTGKNLFDVSTIAIGKALNLVDGSLQDASDKNTSDFIEVQPSETYICNKLINRYVEYDENKQLVHTGTNVDSTPITMKTNAKYFRFSYTSDVINIQFEKNSTPTSYEPYCGGIPSPNPDFPQQIKNVTGNANVKIQNKNLFDKDYFIQNKNNYIDKGNYFLWYKLGDEFKTKFTVSTTLVGTSQNLGMGFSNEIYYAGHSKDRNINNGSAISPKTYDFTNAENVYMFFINPDMISSSFEEVDLILNNYSIQIEQGTTATSYVPHQEQNYPFTFAEGQRGMQGTQLLDDGIHQKRKQIVLDGTENWILSESSSNRTIFYISVNTAKSYTASGEKPNMLSTHFIAVSQAVTWEPGDISRTTISPKRIYFIFEPNKTLEDWKAYLAEQYANGTPVIFEYELEEEEIIPYNETQQAQHNNIKANASSYDDITIISSESDELGFNMNVVAVADANKVINNLDTRLLALEGNTNQSKSLNVAADTKNITKETAEETAENAESSAESEEQ